ncbi:hypothetical protein K432DRAFT_290762 [Lepidopterella palustris CBS 459.81]|uniref:Serine hydrolase domain-containing protein n=1 Tax=Lepidopterella palustris CBS 459.81 TaxID=1314670 RepID=A0A8E2EGW5_9PEZI|nr:hypothetical protein K432DRAFT_290762 [Lepidopterella palustris CBS 459.81]
MRILCLHGMGTNSEILATQTEMIRSLLPAHYEYVFIDGEKPYDAPEQVRDFFPGPYLCYHPAPTPSAVLEAQEMVEEALESEGPFDGVIGFSQGAALAASIMLHRSMAFETLPFRFAIFLCSGLPFSPLPSTVRRMHPQLDQARIDIPTADMYGKQDTEYYDQSKNLVKFCNPASCFTVEHPGGHEVPRSARLVRDVAGAIKKVVQSLELGH